MAYNPIENLFAQVRSQSAHSSTLPTSESPRSASGKSGLSNLRMARNAALYRRHGYVEIGTRPHPIRAGEMLLDMARSVAAGRALGPSG